jgi:hypothetical protein
MSHFCGLVILTPEYAKSNGLDDALAKYDEGLEYPEYCKGEVSDYDKVQFLDFYLVKKETAANKLDELAWMRKFVNFMRGKKGFITKKDFYEQYPRAQKDGYRPYFNHLVWENKEKYAEFYMRERYDICKQFDKCYKKHGEDWNGGTWRKNALGVWCAYSTYNPDSKWDWYTVGGRWNNSIKLKEGKEFTNICMFGEIDFEPYPEDCYEDGEDWLGNPRKQLKEGYEWHYSTKDMPFCLIIDGVWYEKGEMGWWGMTSNEKESGEWQGEVAELLKNIPADAEVYNVDFHI